MHGNWFLVTGNHKLIRCRFIIFGAIDGYSRSITFLKSSNSSRLSTVLSEFTAAVDFLGLPSQIRTDLGVENIEVWHYMVEQHNSRRAVITGASTHNEVYHCVGVLFYETFYHLEDRRPLIH